MNYLIDAIHIFFPTLCITCNSKLLNSENLICTLCRHDLPIICYKDYKDTKINKAFLGRVSIEIATSFLYFRKHGKTKTLMHHLKYKGNQAIGTWLGSWFGSIIKKSDLFKNIDLIVPVPLHKKKLKQRGYNQLTTFGKSLSKQLKCEFNPFILKRISSTKTQTLQQRFDRFKNTETTFQLQPKAQINGKHILLIDDVITTGATLEACCLELQKITDVRISIITMAYTE